MSIASFFNDISPVAIVTGSVAPRVGRTIADHLTISGCRVVLHSHTVEQAEQTRSQDPHQRLVVHGAVENEADIQRMVDEVFHTYQRIDILVNCAAIWQPCPLEKVTAAEVLRYFEVNTLGTFLATRAVGLLMVEQATGGAIVNLGDWALERPYLDHAAYFPSKGAIPTLTRSMAVELGHRNPRVRVNAVMPGPVLLADSVSAGMREAVVRSTLAKRVGTPQHIAHAVQFLIENDFVTGVCLPVDGGRSIYADEPTQTVLRTG